MKAKQIQAYFHKTGPWVNWKSTTDIFTAGSGEKEIERVRVAWKPTWIALRQAVDDGIDLFISHESIGAKARNGSMQMDAAFMLDDEREVFSWLGESGLAVYRCHDYLDVVAEFGVRASWQRGLQLGDNIIAENEYLVVSEIAELRLEDLARKVLRHCRELGQTSLQMLGDPKQLVSRVGTGTGMICDPGGYRQMGADVGICVDDAMNFVRDGELLKAIGFPILVVNHGVAEEWGMVNLAQHLQGIFPDLQIDHLPQQCLYQTVTA
ncbi:MAG: hypothetical protein GKR89_30770 [Candidatus Latescibacteria bacterium]|nr:hypothetical protein [Candidatus Latescibacterota bacterium]